MQGYTYGDSEPTENCPYCSMICRADFVNIGIGFQQCGPYYCEACKASEIGPYDDARELSDREKLTGWYAPDSEPGSSANVIGGRVVSDVQMKKAYSDQFTGNPLYNSPGEVENWFARVRGV